MASWPLWTIYNGLLRPAFRKAICMSVSSFSLSSASSMVCRSYSFLCFAQFKPKATALAGSGFNPDTPTERLTLEKIKNRFDDDVHDSSAGKLPINRGSASSPPADAPITMM